MNIDTNTIFSMTDANQNFSMVARTVDRYGTAIIFKNNKPRYEIRVFDDAETDETASDEEVRDISEKLLKRNAAVYKAPFQTFAGMELYPDNH